ncbi:hypothetical protein [Escherichia coli]|uniref:hypothetical protein n=1 Tax=Escherichia coli TaxID=562 RepID=UPI000DF38136|nr:hypothetical protein [Escherichia coli]EFH2757150.1 hypothetical protein [Escherichia coli]EHN4965638.1 hypothetical protein [Escherichia coli]MBN6245799.1 hypothetical protein [Escherichia coli]MCW9906750.1 hypothetical protein [Escherichia coli]
MTAFAFWLVFFSILPVCYWVYKILFDRIRFMLTPKHMLTLEYIDENGIAKRDTVDVSSDDEFYRIGMSAIRSGTTIRD